MHAMISKALWTSVVLMVCGVVLVFSAGGAQAVTLEELETRIAELDQALEQAEQDETQAYESVAEAAPIMEEDDEAVNVSLYGRFWPRLTYRDAEESSTDITDALSRVGIASDAKVTDTLTALLQGEWDVDIEANGDFGDARQAYVGLHSTEYGLVAIGKQWDPYFNVIAEVTDVYYHRSSPFGYDYESPFRTNNLFRYAHNVGGFGVDVGVQVNGELQDGSGDDRVFRTNAGVSSAPRHVDSASVGVSYRYEGAYLGVSYLRQDGEGALNENLKRDLIGVGGSLDVTDDLYLAFTYQNIRHDFVQRGEGGSVLVDEEHDRQTLDALASYTFGSYKGIAGVFLYDDDISTLDSRESIGYTFTLIKELNPSLDVFGEWVQRDFRSRAQHTVNTFSLGFRYDFDAPLL